MKRLAAGARCAIKMHSKTENVDQLRKDLRNGPSHVFDNHSHCSPIFCEVAAQVVQSIPSNTIPSPNINGLSLQDTLDGLICEQLEEQSIMHGEEDEARGGDSSVNCKNLPDDLFFRIQ